MHNETFHPWIAVKIFIVLVSNEIYFWYIIDIDFLNDNPIYS